MKRTSVFQIATVLSVLFFFSSCYSSYEVAERRVPPPPPQSYPIYNNVSYQDQYQDQNQYGYQEFYNELSPFGDWVNYNGTGYVWVPRVEAGFQPYSSNGHWVMTQYGWTWASDYRWGWAAFHYGRWSYEPVYGWMWMPGNTWGPAWVSWRQSSDYYGWAPLGPRVSINFGGCPADHYTFVPSGHFSDERFHDHIVDRSRNTTIINNTTVINNTTIINNNTTIITGPSAQNVEQVTGRRIAAVNLTETSRAGATSVQNGQVTMYRPNISKLQNNTPAPQPPKVARMTELHEIPANNRLTPTAPTASTLQQPTINTRNERLNNNTMPAPKVNEMAPANTTRPTMPTNSMTVPSVPNNTPSTEPNTYTPQSRHIVVPQQQQVTQPVAPTQTQQQANDVRNRYERQQVSRPNNNINTQPVAPTMPQQEINSNRYQRQQTRPNTTIQPVAPTMPQQSTDGNRYQRQPQAPRQIQPVAPSMPQQTVTPRRTPPVKKEEGGGKN